MTSLHSASLLENARFNALVVVPNAVKGLFRPRRGAWAALTRANADRWAVGLLRGMRASYGPGPVWVRVVRDPALLVLSVEDVRRVLGRSPDPFASDPPSKRKGMTAFQPDALTISRDGPWENRRRFNEAVLDTGLSRLSDHFVAVVQEEAGVIAREAELSWDQWHAAFQRITRRVVFGDAARSDESLTELLGELMSEGNGMPGRPSERVPALMEGIRHYIGAGEGGSLVSLFDSAPSDESTRVEGQVPHWLFATHDTLAINAFRCLALLASHPEQRERALGDDAYLGACLHEAMRLWPTTPMLARETVTDVDWDGESVPAGTQVLIVNSFLHRNPDTHEFADRFAPEEWIDGEAGDDWSFNHLSHGPQGCPGSGLALLLGRSMLAAVLADRQVELLEPKLDPSRPLPHMLDFFAVRFRLANP
ncbi:MAG: cytochrome P450 [Actinobacteria bacterium]|nr:MAG: cytochrome P450 [Actinomycetota bacterium]